MTEAGETNPGDFERGTGSSPTPIELREAEETDEDDPENDDSDTGSSGGSDNDSGGSGTNPDTPEREDTQFERGEGRAPTPIEARRLREAQREGGEKARLSEAAEIARENVAEELGGKVEGEQGFRLSEEQVEQRLKKGDTSDLAPAVPGQASLSPEEKTGVAEQLANQRKQRLQDTRQDILRPDSRSERRQALKERADIVGGRQGQKLDQAAEALEEKNTNIGNNRSVVEVVNAEGELVKQDFNPQFLPNRQTDLSNRLTTEQNLKKEAELERSLVEGSQRRTAINPSGLPDFAQKRETVPGQIQIFTGERPAVRNSGVKSVELGEEVAEIPVLQRFETGVETGSVLASDFANAPAGVRGLTSEAVEEGPSQAVETVATGLEKQGRTFAGDAASSEAESARRAVTRVGLGLGAAGFASGGALTGGRVAGVTGRLSDVKVRSPVKVEKSDPRFLDDPIIARTENLKARLRSPLERVESKNRLPPISERSENVDDLTGEIGDAARERAENVEPEDLPEFQQRVDEDVEVENLQPSNDRSDFLVAQDRGGEPLPRRQTKSESNNEKELLTVEGVDTDLETASPEPDESENVRTFVTDQGIVEIRESDLGDAVDDASNVNDEQVVEQGLTQQELQVLLGDEPGFEDVRQATETGGVEEVFTPERRILASADVEPDDPGISLDDLRSALTNRRSGEARLTPGLRTRRVNPDVDTDFDVNVPDFRRRFGDDTDDFDVDSFDDRGTVRRSRSSPVDDLDDRDLPGRTSALAPSIVQSPDLGFNQGVGQRDRNVPDFSQRQDVDLQRDLDTEQDLDLGFGFGSRPRPDRDQDLPRRFPDDRPPPDRDVPPRTPETGFPGLPFPDLDFGRDRTESEEPAEDLEEVDGETGFRTSLAGLAGFGTEETSVTEEEAEGETLTGLEIRL